MREETSASLASSEPPAAVRLANIAVICSRLQEIDQPREHGPHFVQRADREQIGDRVHHHDARLEAGDVFVGHQQDFFDSRRRWDARRGIAAALCAPTARGRCRSSACCGRSAAAIPRTRNTGSARRGGRPHPRNAPPRWSCRCRTCRTSGCCCPGRSPCRPSCRPAGRCRSRCVRRAPHGPGPARRSAARKCRARR